MEGAVITSYRTRSGIVQALLDISDEGLISRCRCGAVSHSPGWGQYP
jgi:hypothetical protein